MTATSGDTDIVGYKGQLTEMKYPQSRSTATSTPFTIAIASPTAMQSTQPHVGHDNIQETQLQAPCVTGDRVVDGAYEEQTLATSSSGSFLLALPVMYCPSNTGQQTINCLPTTQPQKGSLSPSSIRHQMTSTQQAIVPPTNNTPGSLTHQEPEAIIAERSSQSFRTYTFNIQNQKRDRDSENYSTSPNLSSYSMNTTGYQAISQVLPDSGVLFGSSIHALDAEIQHTYSPTGEFVAIHNDIDLYVNGNITSTQSTDSWEPLAEELGNYLHGHSPSSGIHTRVPLRKVKGCEDLRLKAIQNEEAFMARPTIADSTAGNLN